MTGATLDLADLLAPLPVADFLERWRSRRYLLIGGERRKFDGLFSWDDLNRIVRESDRDPARIELFKEGKEIPRKAFRHGGGVGQYDCGTRLSVVRLNEQLQDGANLVVHRVQESSDAVRELAANLEWHLRERVFVNAYAGWRTSYGFGAHWDDHDVFIVQVAGRKQWNVLPDNRPYPIREDSVRHERPGEPVWSGTLGEGDVLYLPRGWWHEAFPLDEPCLHLTVGLRNRTGLDYLHWLRSRLTSSELFRQDLPRFAQPEARREHFDLLRQELLSAWGPDVDADYFRSLDAEREMRVEPGLPWSVMRRPLPETDDFVVRLNARRPVELAERSEEGGRRVHLTVAGKTRRFAPHAHGLLNALLRGEPLTFAALCAEVRGALSRGQVRLLVAKLLVDGLVSISGPSDSSASDL